MSDVWDKQHGGSHYQKYKIQPSKFVVENELLYPEGCAIKYIICLLYTSPSPRDLSTSRMPSSA